MKRSVFIFMLSLMADNPALHAATPILTIPAFPCDALYVRHKALKPTIHSHTTVNRDCVWITDPLKNNPLHSENHIPNKNAIAFTDNRTIRILRTRMERKKRAPQNKLQSTSHYKESVKVPP